MHSEVFRAAARGFRSPVRVRAHERLLSPQPRVLSTNGSKLGAKRRVAIIDDDAYLLDALDNLVRSAGIASRLFSSAERFLERGGGEVFDLVLVDYQMPGRSGVELISALRASGDITPVIVMTAHDLPKLEERAIAAGAACFLAKPFEADTLIEMIERLILA